MNGKQEIQEIFSKKVRAGRRTYFFDVRSTKAEDYYMTITESIKDTNDEGIASYRKHKIYLAATMKYGLGSKDSDELAFYNKIRGEMDDMKKDTVKNGIPLR